MDFEAEIFLIIGAAYRSGRSSAGARAARRSWTMKPVAPPLRTWISGARARFRPPVQIASRDHDLRRRERAWQCYPGRRFPSVTTDSVASGRGTSAWRSMLRSVPWVSKPSPVTLERMREAESARLFVVHEVGPTSFVIRSEGAQRYTVRLGDPNSCSVCGSNELCVHVVRVAARDVRPCIARSLCAGARNDSFLFS